MPSPADYPNGSQVADVEASQDAEENPQLEEEPGEDTAWRPQRSVDVVPEPAPPEKKHSKVGSSGIMKSVPENPDGSGNARPSRASQNSQKSRKSTFLKRAGTLQKVATFASHMGMDEDELNSDDGKMKRRNSDSVDDNETGTQRLQRALTKETKHKGLFRYTNTLGQSDGMEPDMLMRVSLEDEWQMVSCASLPFTILFFVIFMGFFQQHYGITDIFLAEYPYRRVVGEEAWEINEVAGIYEWLEETYFPYLWATQPSTPEEEQFATSNIYSKLIGGVKITTTRSEIGPCEDELAAHIRCYTKESDADSGSSFFGRRLASSPRKPAAPVKRSRRKTSLAKRILSRARHRNIAQPAWVENTTFRRWATFVKAENEEKRVSIRERRQQQRHLRAHMKFRGDRNPEIDETMPPRHETFWTSVSRRLKRFRPDLKGETPDLGVGNLSSVVESASKTLTQVKADVERWESLKLLRENTLTFELEALVKNDNLKRDLLSVVTYSFSIHSSGSMFSETVVVSLIASAISTDFFQAGLGIIFFVCLCTFSYMLPNRAYMRWKQGRLRSHFMRFWNLVEWAIIFWGWLVMLFFIYERNLIWTLKSNIDTYNKDTFGLPPWVIDEMNQERVPKLLDEAKAVANQSMWVQLIVSYFHIILVFRFFLASRGQPRLAIVLSTIRKAAVDLLHLCMVFMIIFLAYAVSGHMLFGRRMKEFSSFSSAFAYCFKIVMEREYTWAEFTEEDQWTATIWVWSFMILVVLVMVNIFLAMIFDTYGDVRSSVGHSATLWQTTKIVLAHLRHLIAFGDDGHNHRWVPNRELVQSVKAMQCVHVTPWMVKDAFPGIADKQINYLFNLAKNRLENMLVRGNKTSLPAVIASILLAVERMHNELHSITGAWSDEAMRPTVAPDLDSKISAVSQADDSNKATEADKIRSDSNVSRHDSSDAFDKSTEDDALKRDSKVSFSEGDGDPVKQIRKEESDDFSYPKEPPHWLKVQLIPHFQKQKKLLTQVHVQIQRIDRAMHMRGIQGLPKNPEATPRSLKVPFALGTPGDHMFPCGPSTATSFGGFMLPAAIRQSGYSNGNGAKYELLQAFAAPEQPLASPGSGRHQSSRYSEPPSSRGPAGCCSCKPSQPLHD